jgi:hypothetical protein
MSDCHPACPATSSPKPPAPCIPDCASSEKPFSPAELADGVRGLLDTGR